MTRSKNTLPPNVLSLPAPEGARWLALARLRELEREQSKFEESGDGDLLHDFRVSLRRLRSVLRAYRDVLDDSVPRKVRRALSGLAESAGESRDAEVRLDWLRAHRHEVAESERSALGWLVGALRRERGAADRRFRRELAREFAGTAERLERRLRHYRVRIGGKTIAEHPPTSRMVSESLLGLTRELRARMAVPRKATHVRALHLARIAAKRLRYALEPFAESGVAAPQLKSAAGDAVRVLSVLQDELGRINDARLLRQWLRERASNCKAPWAQGGGRLPGLHRLLSAEAARGYAVVTDPASGQRLERALREVEKSARALVTPPLSGIP